MNARLIILATALGALWAQAAAAQLADPVRAMIEAAMATGDAAKVETVVALARQTQPQSQEEIDRLYGDWLASRGAAKPVSGTAEASVARKVWTGSGEFGAFLATGNGSNSGVSTALSLNRDGKAWQHKLTARIDFQRSEGRITREQMLLAYEPRYALNGRLFTYGLAQAERDPIQGFSARYTLSGGIGYHVIDRDALDLAIKVGPALHRSLFVDAGAETRLAGLLGVDVDWRITERLTVTHDANAVAESSGAAAALIDRSNTNVRLVTGFEARITDRLSTRLSYSLDHDSNPPAGGVNTDTYSRLTFVYGF